MARDRPQGPTRATPPSAFQTAKTCSPPLFRRPTSGSMVSGSIHTRPASSSETISCGRSTGRFPTSSVGNLLMAGKHISVTHVAGSSTKLMGNGAQHGVAVAAAALLCNKYSLTPRELHDTRLDELKSLVAELTRCDHDMASHPPTR